MRMVLLFIGCAATIALPIIFACAGVGGSSAPARADAPEKTHPCVRMVGGWGTVAFLCSAPQVDCVVTNDSAHGGPEMRCRWKEQVK